ncbi:MAG: NHL repeat-containing protein [Ahniella sp.]|nr:NHL repeat-containing protein [Ahniella sp.]
MLTRILITLSLLCCLPTQGFAQCTPTRTLVSGYFNNNVLVYDACAGSLIGALDTANRISGPQTITARPDGLIYVVSENNGRILRYDRNSLAFVDVFVETGTSFRPISSAVNAAGDVYVAGFEGDSVRLYDGRTGALKSTPVAARAGGLDGPEVGMQIGPDGLLYIPSYATNSVLRYDPASGTISTFIAANAGGLRRPRGLVFEGNGNVLVGGEGSNQILRFNASGAYQGVFAGVTAPAGMKLTDDGRLLVTSGNSVRIFNASSAASLGVVFQPESSGGMNGATNVETTTAKVDVTQVGSQYWLVGTGQVTARVLEIDMTSATGTLFGQAFDADDVTLKRWGKMRVEFTSCTTANFSWDSTGDNSARFGTGGYALDLLIAGRSAETCMLEGFNNVTTPDFMNGTWVGDEDRDGEGLMISVTPSGLALMTMFTHRPVVY